MKMKIGGKMMGIRILTDSACDLPEDIIEKYGIDVLPIIVLKEQEEYLDKVDISPKEVYDDMRAGEVYKTAQISPNMFNEKFKEYAEKGIEAIYIAFSSGLSGTYQNSLFVRKNIRESYPDFDLEIIDSKSASMGFGLIVLQAAKLAKEGKSKEEILKTIEFYVENIQHIFTVDNIEYLFRGGRVTRTQAFIGGLLNIKPVLHVDDNGKLIPLEKVRGKHKVFKRILDIMEERADRQALKDQLIGISHGDDLESAMKMKELISERFGTDKFLINNIGAAIGAHSGPGTLAIFFLKEDPDRN